MYSGFKNSVFQTLLTALTLLFSGIFGIYKANAQEADTLKCLIVLMDFSDAPGNWNNEELNNILNTPGYKGDLDINMVDYWWEVSRHKVVVQNDIIGTYRAPRTAAYYNGLTWREGITSAAEAFQWVVETYPDYDWDALSLDDDGRFLGLTVIPSTGVPLSGAAHWMGNQFEAPNGVQSGQMVGIRVGSSSIFGILHEYGHMLFDWPDLYSVTGGRGTGGYDIMSGQSWSPGVPYAGHLAEQGWIHIVDITGPQDFILKENGDVALRFYNPADPDEYFIIEARNDQHPTTLTQPLDRGLLIWHVDEGVNANYSVNGESMTLQDHYRVSLEQADGDFDLENNRNGGEEEDVFVQGDAFNDETTPNSRWWDGTSSDFGIDNIELLDDNRISFSVTAPGEPVAAQRVASRETGMWQQGRNLVFRIAGEKGNNRVPVAITLYTIDGQLAGNVLHAQKTPGTYTLPLGEQDKLPKGIYLCRMHAGSKIKSVKVFVEK
jgi:M6 family metalloprotease-like protein